MHPITSLSKPIIQFGKGNNLGLCKNKDFMWEGDKCDSAICWKVVGSQINVHNAIVHASYQCNSGQLHIDVY